MLYTVTRTITPANAATDAGYPLFRVGRPTWLYSIIVAVPTAFNGTTPKLDVFADLAATGLLDEFNTPADLTAADAPAVATGLVQAVHTYAGMAVSGNAPYFAPGIVYGVVSQDGTPGGGLAGSTIGLASVQLVLAAV